MFKASYKIATVLGIPIKLHISVIILIFMYMNDFSFPNGLLIGLGILCSIVLHELGHSAVALSKKCRVREITLMFMGGVAQMESIPRKPFDEILMAIAGPAVSLILGIGLVFLGYHVELPLITELLPHLTWNILLFLGWANIILACFNLIPAFPMDGGRVLRAALTSFVGRLKATQTAATIGKYAALGFGIWGLVRLDFLIVGVAIFIYVAAGQEYRRVLIEERGRPFSAWDWLRTASGQPPPPDDSDTDQVIISPPPYEKGPNSRSRLSEERHDPFSGFQR